MKVGLVKKYSLAALSHQPPTEYLGRKEGYGWKLCWWNMLGGSSKSEKWVMRAVGGGSCTSAGGWDSMCTSKTAQLGSRGVKHYLCSVWRTMCDGWHLSDEWQDRELQ